MADIVIFSSTFVQKGVLFRSAGPHRISTEVRSLGLSCQNILYLHGIQNNILEKICNKFITNETLLVCFSTTLWIDKNRKLIKEKINLIIDHVKTKYNNIRIVFGGASTEGFIHEFNGDVYFTGYGEQYFIPYLKSIIDKKSLAPIPTRFIGNKKIYDWSKEIDSFNFTSSQILYDKSDLIETGEVLPLELSRGCIFKCKFCNYPLTGKKKLDYVKEPIPLREELLENYYKWGITKYVFTDDTFNDNNNKLEHFYNIFSNLPFNINFTTYLRHDLLYTFQHQIPMLKEMGLVGTYFGVETFHPKAGKLIGKGLDPIVSKDFLYKVKELWGNITIQMGLIVGIPYEDYSSLQSTMNFIRDPNCPIESFNINSLSVTNPNSFALHFQNTFQLEAEKYGFNWPDINRPIYWTNDIGPIKNLDEADIIKNEMYSVAKDEGRLDFGGLSHLPLENIVKYTKHKTMANWIGVPRKERIKTLHVDLNFSKSIVVAKYISKLLQL